LGDPLQIVPRSGETLDGETTVTNGPRQRFDRVDPDPVTLFLAILGAAGSVASLLSYLEKKREDSERLRRETRAKAFDPLGTAEVALTELAAHVRALQVLIAEGTKDRSFVRRTVPLRFGDLELFLSRDGMKRWRRLVSQTNATSSRLQHAMLELLGHLASSEYKIPAETADELKQMQAELNAILVRLGNEDQQEDELEHLEVAVIHGQRALASLRKDLERMFG
jgi:hypothetical protein